MSTSFITVHEIRSVMGQVRPPQEVDIQVSHIVSVFADGPDDNANIVAITGGVINTVESLTMVRDKITAVTG